MEKLTIILNDPPYGTEKIYNGLRYASALVSARAQLNLFLPADGVAAARCGQEANSSILRQLRKRPWCRRIWRKIVFQREADL